MIFLFSLGHGCCPVPVWSSTRQQPGSKVTAAWKDKASQVAIQLDLSTEHFDQGVFQELLKNTFLHDYKDALYFQMYIKGLGTDMWNLQGKLRFKTQITRIHARKRFRDKLVSCFTALRLPHEKEVLFADSLEKLLKVEADDSALSGETHFWKIERENVQQQIQPTVPPRATGASAARGPGGALPALPVGPSISGGQAAAASIAWPPPPPAAGASRRCRSGSRG